jgi:hypothetical protein
MSDGRGNNSVIASIEGVRGPIHIPELSSPALPCYPASFGSTLPGSLGKACPHPILRRHLDSAEDQDLPQSCRVDL